MNQVINNKLTNMRYPVGIHISYNVPIITEMAKTFNTIEEFEGKSINIVCTGSSGAIISAIFSTLIPNVTEIHHIKKNGERSHHGQIDRITNERPIIFIDDFIDVGETINRVHHIMKTRQENVDFEFDCIILSEEYKYCQGRPKYLICGKNFVD